MAVSKSGAQPPYYEATEDLFISGHEAGSMDVAAHRKGDRVEPDNVFSNGWQAQVKVPDEFAPKSSPASDKSGKTGDKE